jgi:hypothetical protein
MEPNWLTTHVRWELKNRKIKYTKEFLKITSKIETKPISNVKRKKRVQWDTYMLESVNVFECESQKPMRRTPPRPGSIGYSITK